MTNQWWQSHTSVCYWDVSLPDCEHPLLAILSHYRTGFCHTLQNNPTEEVEATVVQSNWAVNLRLSRSYDVSNLFTLTSDSLTYICPIVCINDFFFFFFFSPKIKLFGILYGFNLQINEDSYIVMNALLYLLFVNQLGLGSFKLNVSSSQYIICRFLHLYLTLFLFFFFFSTGWIGLNLCKTSSSFL